jgi:hypothetical protein
MNTGTPEQAREVGALMYVGQPEYDAGYAAGLRAKGDGVGAFLCVNHYISAANRRPSAARALPTAWAWIWATR